MKRKRKVLILLLAPCALFLFLEIAVRVVIDLPAKTDFYASIRRDEIPFYQEKFGVRTNSGPDWIHLGWIADPEKQRYAVFRIEPAGETRVAETRYGSCLVENLEPGSRYLFRVQSGDGAFDHTVACATAQHRRAAAMTPRIASAWRPVFRPSKTGDYLNDHTVFRSHDGVWHIVGITAFGEGDYAKEKYFAHGVSREFPPPEGSMMEERDPVADFGRLAWAPHVIVEDRYYLWFSPHRAYLATSTDGYAWKEEGDRSFLPHNPQFRDPMVFKVAQRQWLMYATARDGYYSSVDAYQSFDLAHWQYIGPALAMGWGAERAGAQSSAESPFVFAHNGRYFLSVTYNNDSFFWNPLLLSLGVWPDRGSYNETLVLRSTNPYSFGTYRGKGNSPALAAVLEAHAPEYIFTGGKWYITTAGWPWVASLTKGEVAVAELDWKED
ncbi:MAG: hypothetical protein EPN93_10210 [Spirochaetes bacterium]|nr:MAG: hypothetical protein EPN93_10210 [Spirochaetota bacterium]